MHVKKLFSLEDKVAIITGGSKGLGFMIAEGFAEAGARLLLCSRKQDQCEQAAEKIRALGADCHATGCDVADPDAVKAMAALALKQFGKVDILVNNAGMAWAMNSRIHRWKDGTRCTISMYAVPFCAPLKWAAR